MLPATRPARSRTRRGPRVTARALAALVTIATLTAAARESRAQSARASFFLQMVRQNSDPRVRLTAAVRLGELREADTVAPLMEAFRAETDPTVLATMLATLGAIGDPRALPLVQSSLRHPAAAVSAQARRALPALQAAARAAQHAQRSSGDGTSAADGGPDPLASAPSAGRNGGGAAGPRYLIGVGTVSDGTNAAAPELSRAATDALRAALQQRPEVVVHAGSVADAQRSIRAQHLRGHFFDANIQALEPRPNGIRASVSVLVSSYPGRVYEFESQTAITLSGSRSDSTEARVDAVRRAIESAAGRAVDQLNQGTP